MTFSIAWDLLSHFLILSMLSIGGAITTAPDMHRYLVVQNQWLSDAQFSASIAIAQSAPGPNLLFVSLLGWQVGANLGLGMNQWWGGPLGVIILMIGMTLPSSIFTLSVARKLQNYQQNFGVIAFKSGLAPIAIALLFATAWILASSGKNWSVDWPLGVITIIACLVVYFTKLHLLVVLATGALIGALYSL